MSKPKNNAAKNASRKRPLNLAPLEGEPCHKDLQTEPDNPGVGSVAGFGQPAIAPVNRGVHYAQPSIDTAGRQMSPRAKAILGRRRFKIPKQFVIMTLIFVIGGLIIAQEIMYGYAGRLVSFFL